MIDNENLSCSERLAKEKAIIEERCERRLELLKELVKKNSRHDEDEDGALSHVC